MKVMHSIERGNRVILFISETNVEYYNLEAGGPRGMVVVGAVNVQFKKEQNARIGVYFLLFCGVYFGANSCHSPDSFLEASIRFMTKV